MEKYKIPSLLLMERAAESVVNEILGGSYDLKKILIACGTGNNGGDGLAVARMLKLKGCMVDVCVVGALDRMSSDAKQQLEMYQAISGDFVTAPVYHEYTVIVDAIFGIGCNREITGIALEVIEAINEAGVKVIAVDVPSGVSSDTGNICGAAVHADVTVTFFTEKLGMMLYPGREFCGRILVADLGIPFEDCEEYHAISYTEEDVRRLPERKANSHKGTFGKVLVIAGSQKISGAAYLAAAGAYRIGAGLVKIYTPKENQVAMQVLLPEALMEIYDSSRPSIKQLKECTEWADVIVIGPGIGTERGAEKILKYVISKSHVPVVIDADGINLLAKNRAYLLDKKAPVVLTPHIQEMARLTGKSKSVIMTNPMEEAEAFVKNYDVTLVLKSAGTIVTKESEHKYINLSGNSGMATGGSGDVLAGILASVVSRGIKEDIAAAMAVYVHGKCADYAAEKFGEDGMSATDIIEYLPEVIKRIHNR